MSSSNLSIPVADRLRVPPDQVPHRRLGIGNPLEAEISARAVLAVELLDGTPHHPGVILHLDIGPGPETEEDKWRKTGELHPPCY